MAGEALMERPAELVARESGPMALATLSERDFEQRVTLLKLAQDRVKRIQRELMIDDEDYGTIPGTRKPTLLKPGAEKLCQFYHLIPTFRDDWIEGDGGTTPHLRVRVHCELHLDTKDGPVVGEGLGAANSWEKKHRYRGGQRVCPACGCEGTIRRSSFEKDGDRGWYCHDKAGGCGTAFKSTEPKIVQQQAGQVENPDPFEVENTLLKMAAKRSQVDAVLRTTATSGLFTQDVEEFGQAGTVEGTAPKATAAAQAPAPATTTPKTEAKAPPGPKAVPAPATAPPQASQAPSPDGLEYVKAVSLSTAEKKPSRIEMEDGRAGTTFDTKVATLAAEAKEKHLPVKAVYTNSDKKGRDGTPYVNLTSLALVDTSQPPLPIPQDDGEPVGQPELMHTKPRQVTASTPPWKGQSYWVITTKCRTYLTFNPVYAAMAQDLLDKKKPAIIAFETKRLAPGADGKDRGLYNEITTFDEVSETTVADIVPFAEREDPALVQEAL